MIFLLASLAAFRLTVLIVDEEGPFNCFGGLRTLIRKTPLSGLADCGYCMSVWVCAPFILLDVRPKDVYPNLEPPTVTDRLLTWLALSGSVYLMYNLKQWSDSVQVLNQSQSSMYLAPQEEPDEA